MTDTPMTQTDTQPQDVAKVETPVADAALAPEQQSLDELLSTYDRETAQPEPEAATATDNVTTSELDQLIDGLAKETTAENERIGQLEGEVNSLRSAEFQRAEREAFDKFSSELQSQCGPNVPDDFVRTQLLAMSVERPELAEVWRFRNLTREELAAADQEFQRLEVLHWKAQREPDDPRKASALAEMERRGRELGLMMNAKAIISNARREVLNRARIAQPPIDLEMTAMRHDVAWAVKSSGSYKRLPEVQPDWGRMDSQTYRREVRDRYGYDPGT